MTAGAPNIHATAIVIGKTGLLFLGPSGWGKSMLAFACISEGNRLGIASMLVADDQVLISQRNGAVVAVCPPSIAGLIELRGTGIVRVPHVAEAPMHYAILPGDASGPDRLPPDGERVTIADHVDLPAIRLLANTPLPLAVLMAKVPDIGR
ncbi:serine/threonine protein kinase [Rhizobium sp. Root1203]|uniref:HPr kinase/phosphorylase n=1 Tax=Rhizobium sp. Root1203 TaxID=1736427 RepID=UPI00070FB21A|nr:serine/threonine protein kinase [Rhizobium sp. Root1203]KQV20257.1 serine/threonine protein kinase [Rhizobium sp. Root1203]